MLFDDFAVQIQLTEYQIVFTAKAIVGRNGQNRDPAVVRQHRLRIFVKVIFAVEGLFPEDGAVLIVDQGDRCVHIVMCFVVDITAPDQRLTAGDIVIRIIMRQLCPPYVLAGFLKLIVDKV